jgi:protein-tyrosine sulfotransferase
MFNLSIRSFLWFVSIAVFIWFLKTLNRINDCSSFNKKKLDLKIASINNNKNINERKLNPKFNLITQNQSDNLSTSRKTPRTFLYNDNLPIVFVAGIAGSGLKTMGKLLSNNPYIRCSSETFLIGNLISRRHEWNQSNIERDRLMHAGMSDDIIDASVLAFMLEIILKQDKIANNLCNIDAEIFHHALYVHKLLPKAKFLLMIRDARATVNTIYNNGYDLKGAMEKDHKDLLINWNKVMTSFNDYCVEMGPKVCMPVFYENLLLNKNQTLDSVVNFLNIRNVKLPHSADEFPSDSLKTHKNSTDSLKTGYLDQKKVISWFNDFPVHLMPHMASLAPQMTKYGYDTSGIEPNFQSYQNLNFDFY